MSLNRAKEYLKKYGYEDKIQLFNVSSATVELAAKALNTEPERIAKSLTFLVDEEPIMIIAAGDRKISNPKFKQTFNTKAKMIPRDNVKELIGHSVGGVCPFGVNDNVKVYLDESLKEFDTIYPAAGTSNSAIKLTPDELEKISEPIGWVDVCK